MSWIALACIAPVFWSISNLMDEYLAKRRFADNVILLLLVASLMELVSGLGLLALYPDAWEIPLQDKIGLGLLGILITVSFLPYLLALKEGDASLSVPIFQTVPVFVFVAEALFLGRDFPPVNVAISLFIIAAAVGLTWDFRVKRLHARLLIYMLIASLGLAAYITLAGFYTQRYDPMHSYAWVMTGAGLTAVLVYLVKGNWRRQTYAIFGHSGWKLSLIFIVQGIFDILAVGIFFLAVAQAPAAAYVQTMNGLQPLYVLGLSWLAGRFLPGHFNVHALDRYFAWKLVCIVCLFAGVAALVLRF